MAWSMACAIAGSVTCPMACPIACSIACSMFIHMSKDLGGHTAPQHSRHSGRMKALATETIAMSRLGSAHRLSTQTSESASRSRLPSDATDALKSLSEGSHHGGMPKWGLGAEKISPMPAMFDGEESKQPPAALPGGSVQAEVVHSFVEQGGQASSWTLPDWGTGHGSAATSDGDDRRIFRQFLDRTRCCQAGTEHAAMNEYLGQQADQ